MDDMYHFKLSVYNDNENSNRENDNQYYNKSLLLQVILNEQLFYKEINFLNFLYKIKEGIDQRTNGYIYKKWKDNLKYDYLYFRIVTRLNPAIMTFDC